MTSSGNLPNSRNVNYQRRHESSQIKKEILLIPNTYVMSGYSINLFLINVQLLMTSFSGK